MSQNCAATWGLDCRAGICYNLKLVVFCKWTLEGYASISKGEYWSWTQEVQHLLLEPKIYDWAIFGNIPWDSNAMS